MKQRTMQRILCLLLTVILLSAVPISSQGASAFEKSIAAFPESYKVILRQVHKAHPNWVFNAMKTGLSFQEAVTEENKGNNALVPASTNYSYIFKSHANGDYNPSNGTYVQKDGGFCNANRYAVSYFMDPRNHLTDAGIFQFEDLSFDPSFDVQAIDVVLAGTFMYQTKPTYYTSSGSKKTSDETYAEMIYSAGKSYNVNPCFLASKIRSEIGATPSGSVTGTNGSYPGIYNFYNIGATDGAGAITRGLAWAANSSAGTYHRPWTTPKKSIVGGAEYLAATYISKGQFTGYLQRFNVNPDSSYATYQHQYMTNVSGAAEQSYGSYYTYLSNGLLDNAFIFSIPVYENMTGADDNSGTLTLYDAQNQNAKVALSFNINVRKGPSQNYDKLDLTLAPGARVTILDTCFTDSTYYDSILRYPNWYHVRFTQNGTTYKGYVPCGFMEITTAVLVKRGEYTPKASGSKNLKYRFVAITPNTVTVVNDTKLKFTANGTATVLAYDSTGRFAILYYKITDNAPTTTPPPTTKPAPTTKPTTTEQQPTSQAPNPTSVIPSAVSSLWQSGGTANAVTINWSAVAGATGYRVYLFDNTTRSFQPILTTTQTTCTVRNLSIGETVLFKIKAFTEQNGKTYWSDASAALKAATTPDAPQSLKQNGSASDAVSLAWKAVAGAQNYQLYRYDDSSKTFVKLMTSAQTTCMVSGLSPNSTYRFKVRAVFSLSGQTLESADSNECTARTGPARVTGVTQSDTTTKAYKLKWNAVEHADGYKVFRIEEDSYDYILVGKTTNTSFTVTNLSPGQTDIYAVKAYSKAGSKTYYGNNSEEYLAATKPAKVKNLTQYAASDNSVALKWTPADHASGYAVYRYTGADWKKVASVTTEKATIHSLPSGSSMKFRVRAYIRLNEQILWGKYSAAITAETDP